MRKQIIVTCIVLIATAWVTVIYFKNLNPPGTHTSRVMATIPDNAAVIFEFNNDPSFYDIFGNNTLLESVTGPAKIAEIDSVRDLLLQNPLLEKYFTGQNLFISLHPLKDKDADLLLTISAAKGFDISMVDQLAKQGKTGLIINPLNIKGKKGYDVYISALKKSFYIINKEDNTFAGSFSQEMAEQSAAYVPKNDNRSFVLLSNQQNANSLANLYVNYGQLGPLFEQLFQNKNTDMLRSFKTLPALAALSLNYKDDAFMFSGTSAIQNNEPLSYLNLFTAQQPVVNQLKNIFPSTTAYSTNFSVSDPTRFENDLHQYHIKASIKTEKDALFDKIKTETGISLRTEFGALLANEFAVVTTRYEEKLGIISVKDGSKISALMMGISAMENDNVGQFKYEKVPFFLLGDPFSIFKRPYFMVIDNYLVLANSHKELTSYYDSYLNRKFLSKNNQYNTFDQLTAERSNVAFFINFKNAEPILKRDLDPLFYNAFVDEEPGWKDFYGASYQLSAADKDFYTNFCLRLNNVDTTAVKQLN